MKTKTATATKTAPAAKPISHKIVATFPTVAEAVKASKIDLSYNPEEAARKIRDLDRAGNHGEVKNAFLMENGEVWFLYHCDILILNTFEPFSSCLHDGSFFPVRITETTIEIFRHIALPRDTQARKTIAKGEMIVTL